MVGPHAGLTKIIETPRLPLALLRDLRALIDSLLNSPCEDEFTNGDVDEDEAPTCAAAGSFRTTGATDHFVPGRSTGGSEPAASASSRSGGRAVRRIKSHKPEGGQR